MGCGNSNATETTQKSSLNILILGATGDTGKIILRRALEKNHKVTALVRSPQKLEEHANLTIVKGSILDAKDISAQVAGKDVIVCALGCGNPERMEAFYNDSTNAIMEAMKSMKNKHLVLMSAWYTNPENRDDQEGWKYWSSIPNLDKDMTCKGKMEQIIQGTQEINFSVIRAPTLSWDGESGKDIICCDSATWNNTNWVEGGTGIIPREDVAKFFLQQIKVIVCQKVGSYRKFQAIDIKYSQEEHQAAQGRLMEKYKELGMF